MPDISDFKRRSRRSAKIAIAAPGTPGDFRRSRRSAYKIAKCVAGLRSLFRTHLGSFSNDYGDDSENDTIKMNSRFFFPNVVAITPSQMKVKFPGVEFLETAPKFKKKEKIVACLRPL